MAFSFLQWLGFGSAVRPTGELTATLRPGGDHLAPVIDALCAKHQATYGRTVRPDGSVQMSLYFPNGDTLSGTGNSTANAVRDLVAKIDSSPWIGGAS